MKRGFLCLSLLLFAILVIPSREYLTSGPPTLFSLQSDTRDIDARLTKLDTEFQTMKQQAEEGARQAQVARLQLNAMKIR